MSKRKTLPKRMNYLGTLGARLRDLQGYRTLAHELAQNADDVTGATSICFDVSDVALVVDNDGRFSDCGEQDSLVCPWEDDPRHGRMCDFHRFREGGAGDKRNEEGTTGAFGIGFIAVYQITDAPELISAGRHWRVYEDRNEDDRVDVCDGCPSCSASSLPGTRFILPWAKDPSSSLRRALKADAVPSNGLELIAAEVEQALPTAVLFLKRLSSVTVRRNGYPTKQLTRTVDGSQLIVHDQLKGSTRKWWIFPGVFTAKANLLKAQNPNIETKRTAGVAIALTRDMEEPGVLSASLPTEQQLGLPFHINADFFTSNDRKRVILDSDYQSEWNRAALSAAADALAAAAGRLPELLGAQRFWALAQAVKEVADSAAKDQRKAHLGKFWKQLLPALQYHKVVQTTKYEWKRARDTALLLSKDEATAIPLLEDLGLSVVHEDLRPFQSLLRSEAVGVPALNISQVCALLRSQGLSKRLQPIDIPPALATPDRRNQLWSLLTTLLERQRSNSKALESDRNELTKVSIAPAHDGSLCPPGETWRGDEKTVGLFLKLRPDVAFLAEGESFRSLAGLCATFDVSAALAVLQDIPADELHSRFSRSALPLKDLFDWLQDRRGVIMGDVGLRSGLAKLMLFPSGDKLWKLDQLSITDSSFQDPLGLSKLVDLKYFDNRHEFLRDLGMPVLDFQTYATVRLPEALRTTDLTPEQRRSVVRLLAERIGELRDNPKAQSALAEVQLVECKDGAVRTAGECHFETPAVQACLGDQCHYAMIPNDHPAAVRDLYEWLGVATKPRIEEIVQVLESLADGPVSTTATKQVLAILEHLASLGEECFIGEDLRPLRSLRWLPAAGHPDRWHKPDEVYAGFQRHLFESQAKFLDVPIGLQQRMQAGGFKLLEKLGVRVAPEPELVVNHLLHCAAKNETVNTQVYQYLEDQYDDPAIAQLREKPCLWTGSTYHAPNQVYWGSHTFGRYRLQLADSLRSYQKLLARINVRQDPTVYDAVDVIREISQEFGAENAPLDDEAHSVLMACWRMLDQALRGDLAKMLDEKFRIVRGLKCVPNAEQVLQRPEHMFFESRAGLAAKFGLENSVITRPIGADRALHEAGVREMWAAVNVEVLECPNITDDAALPELIRSRRDQIARVLRSSMEGHELSPLLEKLQAIHFEAADALKLRYRLNAFNTTRYSQPEEAPALYQSERNTLVYVIGGSAPWRAIARELALALFPEGVPGQYAAALKEVLSATSVDEAAQALDELGLARIDTEIHESTGGGRVVEGLGTDEITEHAPAEGGTEPDTQGSGDLSPEDALKSLLGDGSGPPTPPVEDPIQETTGKHGGSGKRRGTPGGNSEFTGRAHESESGESDGDGESKGRFGKGSGRRTAARKKGRPVLRSYVQPDGQDDEADDGTPKPRSPVDEAGVSRVLEFERSEGRTPKEMPHNNRGYDVESYEPSGALNRYIEVKSFAGEWDDTYAVLSRPQFEKGQQEGDRFWLYVIENAGSNDQYRIHRIQNPAGRANLFMFDDGWRSVAENDSTVEASAAEDDEAQE